MEPDVMPLHPSSPPPLDSNGEVGSEEEEDDEFGEFTTGFSCSPPSSDSPSSLKRPPTATKPAAHQSDCSLNQSVEQYQPTSTVNSGCSVGQVNMEGVDYNAESHVHLTNGFSGKDHSSRTHMVSAVGARSPREETGFADFTVFTEQAAHPWCCGFTPLGDTEQWDGRAEGVNSSQSLGGQIANPGREVIMASEPRSHGVYKTKQVCTIEHCEKRDAALVQTSQEHRQPQGAAAASGFPLEEDRSSGEEEFGEPGDRHRKGRDHLNTLQTTEGPDDGDDQERRISAARQTFGVCDSASEDLTSLCDDFSLDCPSADLEPNVSSFTSEGDQTDWDPTDDEEEEELELRKYRRCDSFVNNSTASLRQTEAENGFHYRDQSATQETCATSNHSQPGTNTGDTFADVTSESSLEHQGAQGRVQLADGGLQSLGNLPPSDSFADFCSAPTQEDGGEAWAEFKDQRGQEEGRSWTQLREQVSSLQTDGNAEGEQERMGNGCQATLSDRVQQLLLASFPEVEVPAVEREGEEKEEEEEVLGLGALVHAQHHPGNVDEEEEETPEPSPSSQWMQQRMWWPHQDLHRALGLRFQWGGSHTNRTLLRCLGVDTRNIVFMGVKKQPVTVPAFASSLGMLEPTKDSVSAVCSPRHTADTAQAPPGPRDSPDPPTDPVQEALPSSQLDWSSRGLSSSQDGCSALNLDYFGPEEEGRSSSSISSSRSNSPPPGVDRELYELTISRMETSTNSSQMEDTLNRLMSTAEKTSTSVRKPQQDTQLSAEADRVISCLPNLTFMQAKVLMFPSILRAEGDSSPK